MSSAALEPKAGSFEDWDAASVREVLQQVARDGTLEKHLLADLQGGPVPEGEEAEGEAAEEAECALPEMLLTAELCAARRVRDFLLFSLLAERLTPEVAKGSPEMLRRLGTAFSTLGVLNQPLFQELAVGFLAAWKAGKEPPAMAELVEVARCFSIQRMRHEELFERLVGHLRTHGAEAASPKEALSLLHSHAFLRSGDELGDLWPALEERATSPGLEEMGLGPLSQLCYVLALSQEADAQDLASKLEVVAKMASAAEKSFWQEGEGLALHRRVVLLRSVMRYLHKDEYRTMSEEAQKAFRRIHRLELPPTTVKPMKSFTRKLSAVLGKMRIGHACNMENGGFTLDIVERDRKIVYECNHFDRYYAGTLDKIASMCLQERVVKAMGYRMVQVPHWQWTKIMHRRQRAEYLRMSRYYAIKDRRELSPRDEAPEDVAVNEFDHLGEYFFKKEMPSSAWSWFQPRYDARKRIPETAAAAGQ